VTLRPATRADFDAIADLYAAGVDLYDELEFDRAELDQWLTSPRLDLERDIRLYEEDGRLLAYVDVDPLGEDPVMWWADVRVHPDTDVASVVPLLLAWAESRAVGGVLRTWAPTAFPALVEEFERAGMRRLRGSYRMEIDLGDDVAEPRAIGGIEIRPLDAGQEEVAYDVHQETFEDSWDHVREPYDEWRHYLVDTETFDPSLWFVAWDGDDPAGIALCRARGDLGWVGVLGVRRAWRRRGVGRALLLHALQQFRSRGLPRGGLGVDAESLTGAHELYASAGMRVMRELGHYEKPVPA
jgi:mycothiol synthase